MLAFVVSVRPHDVEVASDALWGLGVLGFVTVVQRILTVRGQLRS